MTSVEESVVALKHKCQKIVDGKKEMEEAYSLLEGLEGIAITVDVLTKTRIGMTVNDLRKKTKDEKLAKRAKALIKKWKAMIDTGVVNNNKDSKPVNYAPAKTELPPAPKTTTPHVFKRTAAASNDTTRCQSITALAKSLRAGELPDGTQDPDELAERIEEAIFQHTGGVNDRYRANIRSRMFNLRDKKNPALRENVLTGAVRPERFAKMSAEEMASDEMKKQRESFHKEAIMEHQMSVQEGTPSDMFRCGRCGKNNCTYNQMQTRSADEPMTTFVFCRTCGNRWKFC
ncbi:unnamed protein product [Bursaphelenchus okinawaensis]|uniref:Transcription elongation factor n=1 Tax=Bursaphelenchus okinawaensis TaxID=465554 RepID=A0A811JVX2_9BILA|nr:unnamed protein product [Bursaphelenchus okinawaensis]CAG9085521.1 unnamed protein product [Bursaphelenchus okinawaensis]